jgi:hypothetical protein
MADGPDQSQVPRNFDHAKAQRRKELSLRLCFFLCALRDFFSQPKATLEHRHP